jgi:hypothetical protein
VENDEKKDVCNKGYTIMKLWDLGMRLLERY